MAQLFTLPKQLSFDNGALLRAGDKLYFYETTTLITAPVYTDAALTTEHTQPVESDINGMFPVIWLDSAVTYKLTRNTAADALVYTIDPVNPYLLSQAEIGEILYPITQAEIDAGVTPVSYNYLPGNVLRYGTNTTPGTTDMTTAIQSAIDQSAEAGGAAAYLPPGDYLHSATLGLMRYARFSGDGYLSHLIYTGAGVAVQALGSVNPDVWRRGEFSRIRCSTSTGTHGIRIKNLAEFEVTHNQFEGFSVAGIHLTGDPGDICLNIWVTSNISINNGLGLLADGVNNINQIAVHHNQFQGNTNGGIRFEVGGKGLSIVGNDIEGNGDIELYLNGGNITGAHIAGNYLENASPHALISISETLDSYGIDISGNLLQGGSTTDAIILGQTSGVVYGVTIKGNAFIGTITNAINANSVAGGEFGPNYSAATNHLIIGPTSTAIRELNTNGSFGRVGGRGDALLNLAYSTSISTNAALAKTFIITATDGVAFTINTPTNLVAGMEITYEIFNSSGGAMGAITWTGFKLSGAFTNPATGNIRMITFYYDGGSLREISRTAADQAA